MIVQPDAWTSGTGSALSGAAPTAETTRAESSEPSITSLRGSGAGIMGEEMTEHFIYDRKTGGIRGVWVNPGQAVPLGVTEEFCPVPGLPRSDTGGFVTKDSGAREEMPTGSVRDTREGKGRFDLISPFALRRLAGVYERGSVKYASRNWEKGQPFSRCLDSALRHLNSFAMGWTDEDHLAQALWNVAAIIHFQEVGRNELDDMPHYQSGPNASCMTLSNANKTHP